MKVITDTATIVMFDPDQLQHRINESWDWWTDEDQAVEELNQGNALFLGVDTDGAVEVQLNELTDNDNLPEKPEETVSVQANLHNTSGQFYIGPGEATTGEGEEPEESESGHLVKVSPGNYQVTIRENGEGIKIWLKPITEFVRNEFEYSPVLYDVDEDYEEEYEEDYEIADVIEMMCEHLEALEFQQEEYEETDQPAEGEEEEEEELVYYHEDYGYLMLEEYEGGIRFYTTVEYDADMARNELSPEDWQNKLTMVLNLFNSTATVARASDDQEGNQLIIDSWYPAVYTELSFDTFLELWQEDLVDRLEDAESDIFGEHSLH